MSSFSGHTPLIKKLKGDAIPSQFSWTTAPSPCSGERGERAVRRTRKRLLPDCDSEQEESIVFMECQDIDLTTGNFEEVAMHEELVYVNQQVQATVESSNKDTQTDACNADYTAPEIVVVVKINATTIDAFVNDPEGMQFYTGLDSVDVFTGVLASLEPAAHKLKYLYAAPTLDVRNQLLLTLIKLRLYITNFQLGRMFEVTQLEVYNIFVTWVKFMSKQWRKINIWPERDTVRHFAPTDFKTRFPTTRAIFDGTECPVIQYIQSISSFRRPLSHRRRYLHHILQPESSAETWTGTCLPAWMTCQHQTAACKQQLMPQSQMGAGKYNNKKL